MPLVLASPGVLDEVRCAPGSAGVLAGMRSMADEDVGVPGQAPAMPLVLASVGVLDEVRCAPGSVGVLAGMRSMADEDVGAPGVGRPRSRWFS